MKNAITGVEYQGLNVNRLERAKKEHEGWGDEWMTFVQAKAAGRRVLKGSKSVLLRTFVKKQIKGRERLVPVYFSVFNIAQTSQA